MTVERKVYFNFARDNVTWIDMSDYVISVSGTIGRTDARARVADVGTVTIELANENKHFSPEFTAGPYYGQLVPNIPVKVEVTDDTGTHRLFTVWTTDFEPQADQYGTLRCTMTCMDRIGQLQDADISLPIIEAETAGQVLRKITSDAYESGLAVGTVYMRDIANSDDLTIGDQTYTFKINLTPVDNEVSMSWQAQLDGYINSAVNLAAAINRDEGSGTIYAAGTDRHAKVTALGYMGRGLGSANQDGELYLQRTGTAYQAIAAQLSWKFNFSATTITEPTELPMRRVYLYLKKVGNPTGTLTLRHELPASAFGSPSGTLYNAGGIVTMSEADLTTSFAWYAFDVPVEYQMNCFSIPGVSQIHWLVLSTDRATSATDYVAWGYDTAVSLTGFALDIKTAGIWAGRDNSKSPIFFLPAILDVEANARGAWGNALVLQTTGSEIAVSGAVLVGGTDGPVGSLDFEAGVNVFDYAGDTWTAGETNALTAVQETVESEFGLFWAAKDGTLTFRDHHHQFELANAAAAMTINDQQSGQTGRLSKNDLINRATVSYRPRSVAAAAVIAKIKQPIKVLGTNTALAGRWNKTAVAANTAGQTTVIVPYVDQGTAERVGAIDIVQPLTPTTDFTVYDTADKTGFNYTTTTPLKFAFAFALVASGVQVHIRNTATGPLWIHDLQISGSALVRQDSTQAFVEDSASRATYGLRAFDYTITFPSQDVDEFAYLLGTFWVNAHKTPFYLVDSITVRGEETIGGVSVFDVEIGDQLLLSETQTAVSNYKMMIAGMDITLPESDVHSITYYLQRLDMVDWWFLETTGASELGVTTYLGL